MSVAIERPTGAEGVPPSGGRSANAVVAEMLGRRGDNAALASSWAGTPTAPVMSRLIATLPHGRVSAPETKLFLNIFPKSYVCIHIWRFARASRGIGWL